MSRNSQNSPIIAASGWPLGRTRGQPVRPHLTGSAGGYPGHMARASAYSSANSGAGCWPFLEPPKTPEMARPVIQRGQGRLGRSMGNHAGGNRRMDSRAGGRSLSACNAVLSRPSGGRPEPTRPKRPAQSATRASYPVVRPAPAAPIIARPVPATQLGPSGRPDRRKALDAQPFCLFAQVVARLRRSTHTSG